MNRTEMVEAVVADQLKTEDQPRRHRQRRGHDRRPLPHRRRREGTHSGLPRSPDQHAAAAASTARSWCAASSPTKASSAFFRSTVLALRRSTSCVVAMPAGQSSTSSATEKSASLAASATDVVVSSGFRARAADWVFNHRMRSPLAASPCSYARITEQEFRLRSRPLAAHLPGGAQVPAYARPLLPSGCRGRGRSAP